MAIVDSVDLGFEKRVKNRFAEVLPEWQPVMLDCDEEGATVTKI